MEVQDLREFITDTFVLHDRILDERFKNMDLQFAAVRDGLSENSLHHVELKEKIQKLQEDVDNVKAIEAAIKQKQDIKQELEQYKTKMESKYSLLRILEKYPKIIFTIIVILIGLLFSGDMEMIFKLLGI